MELSVNKTPPTLASWQPLNSEAGRLAQQLVVASDLPVDVVQQVAHDLTALPLNWLKRLHEENVGVVVMKTGQTLADTSLWPEFTPADCEEMLSKAAPLVSATVAEFLAPFADMDSPEEKAYALHMSGDELKQKIEKLSVEESLGFGLQVSRQSQDFAALAHQYGIDSEDPQRLERWTSAFQRLNQGLIEPDLNNTARPKHGFYLIPYAEYKGKPYRTLSLESLKSITGLELSLHDGANYPENHFITVHDTASPDPSPHMGHHRVVLHESGHMVDWLTRAMPEIGPKHEQRVQQLYAQAVQADRTAQPGQSPLLTQRAGDTAGEFFAEAIEAYLTLPVDDKADITKAANNRLELQRRNPELFNYVDWVLKL